MVTKKSQEGLVSRPLIFVNEGASLLPATLWLEGLLLLFPPDLSCSPAPKSGVCPSTLQVGPQLAPGKQLHSPGTLSC